MELELRRYMADKTNKSTISPLFIDGVFECYILEDVDRGLSSEMPLADIRTTKIHGETAIPYGRYKIVITKSERFSKLKGADVYLPLLLKVPGFEGVRAHPGNKPENSDGCLLPGTTKATDMVLNSATAFISLNNKINASIKQDDEVWITLKGHASI